MRLAHVTGLGRHLDPALPSNRTALLGSVAAGVVHGALELLTGGGIVIIGSVIAGALVFLAWAIAREIDPDHPSAASLAMALAAPFAVLGDGSAFVVAALLIALRMVAGTTGVALKPADIGVVVAAAIVVGFVAGGWAVVPLLAAGVAMAAAGRGVPTAMLVTVAGLAAALLAGTLVLAGDAAVAGVCLAVVLVTLTGRSRERVASKVDAGGRLMETSRIHLAERLAAGAAVLLALSVAGGSGFVAAAPVVAAWLHRQTRSTHRSVARL